MIKTLLVYEIEKVKSKPGKEYIIEQSDPPLKMSGFDKAKVVGISGEKLVIEINACGTIYYIAVSPDDIEPLGGVVKIEQVEVKRGE